ncbi:alkylation response protein AidB-like acyl-CoA dehydrogenase [Catenuloplanes nepalensis]|uniref:Alkylation response protein AidB-like acyl-CoA dehydrogenase n=1 Tax=Catenuloplanes nepalensis TaxID=587533 RepID=A0ABT9MNS8_9ACTN|nr:acyl-CoA dehydrogenase family protein [Catenuloplanes nepalensis]MDP9792976.1 alkylation response protein AidB-like acyl-CoA dehydrogenase [Catenuloplanes nepalensis]
MTPAELQDFTHAVDGVLSAAWPQARAAGDDPDGTALRRVWAAAAEYGWTDLASDDALDAAVAALGRLGRVACPLPLMDVYVTARLVAGEDELAAGLADGSIRPVVAVVEVDAPTVRFVEAAGAATHVVLLRDAEIVVRRIIGVTETPGLARPSWADVSLAPEVTWRATPGATAIEDAKALLRLGLAARAVGAAERTVEFSIAHATERVAFGKPIGAFQAVSHRAVDGATDMRASRALIGEAVRAHLAGRENWPLAVQLAVQFAAPAAVRAQFGAQHTLAASGYFEEHDAPWLFRRVNADVSLLDAITLAAGDVADVLIASGHGLPALELGERAERFRTEVREFAARFAADVPVVHLDERNNEELRAAAVERGYLTLSWPEATGGRGASVEEQMVFSEELAYQRLPLSAKGAADMLGAAITRHGSPAQQARFLPLIASGRFPFYLGYSEPEIGSDLANLKTSAVRDGDEWIVNGRKMWGTGADRAEWVWLATRTDPDAVRPHAGITVFLTRIDRPGFEAQNHTALSGEISCSTFFDDFRIPDEDRIGEVNGGWKVITEALAQERVIMANTAASVLRLLDDLLAEVRKDPAGTAGLPGSAKRQLISELAARLQAARVLVDSSVRATATAGGGGRLEAPMAKILATQLLEDFSEAAMRIFGPAAALGEGVPDVPGRGAFEYNLRLSIMQVVGGGTIDIQRNLVARALGLPR